MGFLDKFGREISVVMRQALYMLKAVSNDVPFTFEWSCLIYYSSDRRIQDN
jgi:hypothetical protein